MTRDEFEAKVFKVCNKYTSANYINLAWNKDSLFAHVFWCSDADACHKELESLNGKGGFSIFPYPRSADLCSKLHIDVKFDNSRFRNGAESVPTPDWAEASSDVYSALTSNPAPIPQPSLRPRRRSRRALSARINEAVQESRCTTEVSANEVAIQIPAVLWGRAPERIQEHGFLAQESWTSEQRAAAELCFSHSARGEPAPQSLMSRLTLWQQAQVEAVCNDIQSGLAIRDGLIDEGIF